MDRIVIIVSQGTFISRKNLKIQKKEKKILSTSTTNINFIIIKIVPHQQLGLITIILENNSHEHSIFFLFPIIEQQNS